MYGKIFAQIYEGTLASRGPWQALVTFQQLIVLANRHGEVDMTPEAISARTTIPLEIIKIGLAALEKDDPDSRTPAENGRRIVLLNTHRSWGWRIVNYDHYRKMRSEDERREYMRNFMAEKRAKLKAEKSTDVSDVSSALAPVSNVSPCSKQYAVSSKNKTSSSEPDGSDEEISKLTSTSRKKPRKEPSAEGVNLARHLRGRILENNPNAKITDSQERNWAIEADRMIARDNRTPAAIREMIDFSQADSFWCANVLSMGKLREQFDQLWLKCKGTAKPSQFKPGLPMPQRKELNDEGRKIYERYGVSA